MHLKIKSNNVIHYLLLYMVIASGGSAWGSMLGNDLFVLLTFCVGVCFLLFSSRGSVEKRAGYAVIFGTIFCVLAMVYSTLSIGTYLNFTGKFLLAYAAVRYNEEEFGKRFVNLAYILSLISCTIFILSQVVGFGTLAPLYTRFYTNASDGAYNLGNGYGLFVYRFVPLHANRNCGMFTEPGEYAVVLAVALFFVLRNWEDLPEKKRNRTFLILCLAMITTQSTSGYAMFVVILIAAFLSWKIPVLHSGKLWAVVAVAMLLFGNQFVRMYDMTITRKIVVNGSINLLQGTARARSESIISVFEYIAEHPSSLLGLGFEAIQSIGLGSCAGLLTTLLAIGIFAFCSFHGYLISAGWNNRTSTLLYVVSITVFLIAGLSQPGTGFAVCYLMFMARKTVDLQMDGARA